MSSLSKRLRLQQKGKALKLLRELKRRIEREELDVVSTGDWMESTPDRRAIIFHVKDSENREESDQS